MENMKLWEFYDDVDAIVYVCDVETYELVYLNKRSRRELGLTEGEDITKLKCYETLQNCAAPCSMCNNKSLKVNSFERWEYFNPLVKKNYLLLDSLIIEDGRTLRMEIGIDVTESVRKEGLLGNSQDISRLLLEGLRLMNSQEDQTDALKVLIEYMGKTLGADRVYIFEENEMGSMDNTYEWARLGVEPQIVNLQNIPKEVGSYWFEAFADGKEIVIEDVENIKDKDAPLYELIKQQEINTLVAIGINDNNGEITTFCGVDNVPVDKLGKTLELLQLVRHFIESIINRKRFIEKLSRLSYLDQLTGLGNRHAFNEYLTMINPTESMGVVYSDITGLKHTNDTKGHHYGDLLIIRACDCLKQVFSDYKLFRIGGDELLVLCAGINEDDLNQRVEVLKSRLQENDVVMAIGISYSVRCNRQAEKLIQIAEERMYDAKRLYYISEGTNKTEVIDSYDLTKNRTMLHYERFIKKSTKLLELNIAHKVCYLYSIDFKDFKMVNYHYGISGGNAMLRTFEEYLQSLPLDLYYERVFGDNFLILQIDDYMKEDDDKLERCQFYVNTFLLSQKEEYPKCNLQIYFGVVRIQDNNIVEAIDNANIARKEGKKNGQYANFGTNKYSEHIKEKQLEREIQGYLKDEAFTFYLQPQNCIKTGEIVGSEALARLEFEDGSVVNPNVFIPVLEKSTAIVELDLQIIKKVCIFLRSRLDRDLPITKVSINLSRMHAYIEDSAKVIDDIVEKYDIPKDYIVFEITEKIFIEDIEQIERLCRGLTEYGYQISIDDFGAGYAGFSMWNDICFSQIKLDQKFLAGDCYLRKQKDAIMSGVVHIGNLLGACVLCEGTETKEDLEKLSDIGCYFAQGYYFSKPIQHELFYKNIDTHLWKLREDEKKN